MIVKNWKKFMQNEWKVYFNFHLRKPKTGNSCNEWDKEVDLAEAMYT